MKNVSKVEAREPEYRAHGVCRSGHEGDFVGRHEFRKQTA
jgi:hypothetical protein